MKTKGMSCPALCTAVIGLLLMTSRAASPHCDTMSGPVVTAARHALETGNVNLVLIWVRPQDEAAIRGEFARARTARRGAGRTRAAAEMHFFESLVRIHRAGEGEPFTGIKPAGTDLGPAVPAADRALESGSATEVQKVVEDAVQAGIRSRFAEALERHRYDPNDVSAGRAFVKAYVEYLHYVEALYEAATAAAQHEHGQAEAHSAPRPTGR